MDYALSDQLREKYQLDISFISLVMIGFILLALFSATVIGAQQVVQAARVPTIRLQRTRAPPELPLAKEHTWHMFLSQCARLPFEQLVLLYPDR